jgi:CTP:molybdopterin cytidylyltransferase MocA
MTLPVFAGLILAGGEGTRWGGPKAWARLPDGQTFLDACSQMLITAGATPVMVTLPPGRLLGEVPAGAEQRQLPAPGLDMLASIRIGLEELLGERSWEAVVVLPVDHPLVAATTPRVLVAAGPPAAIPTLNGRHGHPVCLWRQLAARVVSDHHQVENLRQVLKAAPARDVAVIDPGVRANCNTPEALRQGLELSRSASS